MRTLIVLEREFLDLSEAIEQLNEKQELLATLMKGQMSMQKVAPEKYQEKIFEKLKELEEQTTKEALELLGRKHKLGKLEKERGRAWMLQGGSRQEQKMILLLPQAFPPSVLDQLRLGSKSHICNFDVGFPRIAPNVEAVTTPNISECYFWSFRDISCLANNSRLHFY